MHIEENRPRIIFKYVNNDIVTYKIGLSKKDKDGKYINGYMNCRFTKDTNLENKQLIRIIDGWVDFYIKDKITYPYVFINKFEIVESGKWLYEPLPQNAKTNYNKEDNGIELKDADLPF